MADHDQPQRDLSAIPAFLRRSIGRLGSTSTSTSSTTSAAAKASRRPDVPQPGKARAAAEPIDPASLPMPISRRRLAFIAGGLAVSLLVVAFGHQVSDAAAASDRAAQLRATNAALRSDLADLQSDLVRVGDDTYVGIAARQYQLGAKHEIPVVLAAGAP